MHKSVYAHATSNREEILGAMGKNHDDILAEAQRRWNTCDPDSTEYPKTLGVDGSHNCVHYQGVDLCAATSIATEPDGTVRIAIPPEVALRRGIKPSEAMRSMEIRACAESVKNSDLVLMDGSLLAMTYPDDASSRTLLNLVRSNRGRIIFISKTSSSEAEFESIGSAAGDMYYYNIASREPGFSNVYHTSVPDGSVISSSYVRLAQYAPLMRIEVYGDTVDMPIIMAQLSPQCVHGYPHALRAAHDLCTITDDDMQKLASLIGMHDMVHARAVLR